ncbi:hypothetical protein GGE16_003292 [Rhizobium leguminosarum]|uniref:Uncharacterized protein n=1 Tax=Rhizobium leguminosarum TaxID=384 RepID=A0AAE2MKR2_RHILE|nr:MULTISPECIES: hypothetical protein [Rhizobium]MBB4291233.1 hypothetical protein [Rhizobium leguminosarum]MBB4297671.1 hypothetical protein [Rhizobium leguminosarum]MBB4308811.1 hypothetical protein [Rhizobium leguminosarum]MBB4416646.1 hypothetical protein [Rhizobium leguminosarum]MBB4430386.1 hypothetical protein [Rhizobium esperanzae]
MIWMPSRQLQGNVSPGDPLGGFRSPEAETTARALRLKRLMNFPCSIIKNFEMFTDCFGFFSELCHFLGDEIVFSEPTAVEMPHA